MRQFELVNELGQSFGLNDIRSGFLQDPTGLGYSMEYSYARIGHTWKTQYIRDAQSTITGTVVFGTTSPYEAQQAFLQFVRSSKTLAIKRTTPAGAHYKDIEVVSYDVSEIKEGNTLQCPITMMATSLWYTSSSEKATIIASMDNEVRYDYRFPSRFNDYSDGYLEVNNLGSIEASFGVEFYGGIVNPVIALEVEGVEVEKVEITASISSGSKIIFSSKDGDLYCYSGTDAQIAEFKRSGSTTGLTNLALGFSLSNTNFFKIPIGTSRLHITATSQLTNPIMVSIFKYYRAV